MEISIGRKLENAHVVEYMITVQVSRRGIVPSGLSTRRRGSEIATIRLPRFVLAHKFEVLHLRCNRLQVDRAHRSCFLHCKHKFIIVSCNDGRCLSAQSCSDLDAPTSVFGIFGVKRFTADEPVCASPHLAARCLHQCAQVTPRHTNAYITEPRGILCPGRYNKKVLRPRGMMFFPCLKCCGSLARGVGFTAAAKRRACIRIASAALVRVCTESVTITNRRSTQ